jgi:transcriptional regulator with XRE-family HTH domain
MTQKDLAEKLGYTFQFITNWERGASKPPFKILQKLCKVLGIKEKELKKEMFDEDLRLLKEKYGIE